MDALLTHPLFNGLLLLLSVGLLWKGSDWLVEGASQLGRAAGMSDLTIGLTIVAFGTSAPEFAVTITAAIKGYADISVGNVVGSNIFNIGFILGGCALFRALSTDRTVVYRDGGLLVATSLTLVLLLHDLQLQRWEGALLFVGLFAYLLLLWHGRAAVEDREPDAQAGLGAFLRTVLGLAGVVGGGELLVRSATELARAAGLSEWVIAVTIVAAGTSAPELATSLMAAAKGRMGMSLGNLIGSDLFNLLGVLGVAGLIRPMAVAPESLSSLYMLVGMCLLAVILMRTGWQLRRWEGLVLVAIGAVRWTLDILGW